MCKLIRFFYLLIPVNGFRALLIQAHISACSVCKNEWGMDLSGQEALTKPEWIAREHNLWPQIQKRIQAGEREKTRSMIREKTTLFPRWQWALASGLVLIVLIGISFVLDIGLFRKTSKAEVSSVLINPRVDIIYAEIHGKRAKPFIYQTQENLFIWFDELNREDD
jgi:hypothetical protein